MKFEIGNIFFSINILWLKIKKLTKYCINLQGNKKIMILLIWSFINYYIKDLILKS